MGAAAIGRPYGGTGGGDGLSNFKFQMALLTSCLFAKPMRFEPHRIAECGGK